jgi:hypothetical protein
MGDPKEDAMNETLSVEDRRNVRTTLAVTVAFVCALALSPFAWAGVNPPAAETRGPSLSSPAPVLQGMAEETMNESLGCGCDEACLVR